MKFREKDEAADPMSRCSNTIQTQWIKKAAHRYAAHKRYPNYITGNGRNLIAAI
ncbi:MAG: hypothetical protein IKQ50_01960 [Paludibacteraceae bacterium]|nr:hypothetical protein [Paludibacteraceae bacterium]